MNEWCEDSNGAYHAKKDEKTLKDIQKAGYSFANVEFYCQTRSYVAINNARQDALYQSQQDQFKQNYEVNSNAGGITGIKGDKEYNKEVLGLKYADEDETVIVNPFQSLPKEEAPVLTCPDDGAIPDSNGCCTGEIYTDMGADGFNCCPETGGDCFPPIK